MKSFFHVYIYGVLFYLTHLNVHSLQFEFDDVLN